MNWNRIVEINNSGHYNLFIKKPESQIKSSEKITKKNCQGIRDIIAIKIQGSYDRIISRSCQDLSQKCISNNILVNYLLSILNSNLLFTHFTNGFYFYEKNLFLKIMTAGSLRAATTNYRSFFLFPALASIFLVAEGFSGFTIYDKSVFDENSEVFVIVWTARAFIPIQEVGLSKPVVSFKA